MSDETWPSWRYGPNGEARVFQSAEDVPEGWVDHPSLVRIPPAAPVPSDDAFDAAADPLDHDGNGEKGGSLKGAASTAAKGAARKRKAK